MTEKINILENILSQKSPEIINQAFEQIFYSDLSWTIPEDGKEEATTEIIIRNSINEEEKIPVILFSSLGKTIETETTKTYYLSLGDKNGPTRNSFDPRVTNLALHIFGKSK